jgi:hypothetical protein
MKGRFLGDQAGSLERRQIKNAVLFQLRVEDMEYHSINILFAASKLEGYPYELRTSFSFMLSSRLVNPTATHEVIVYKVVSFATQLPVKFTRRVPKLSWERNPVRSLCTLDT